MLTIHKFPLEDVQRQEVQLRQRFQPLTVQAQGYQSVLWALVDTSQPPMTWVILRYATGEPMKDGEHREYIATVQDRYGLVWHYFWTAA